MKKLSFVTTCMGRLEHLKQSLPLQRHHDCESIVVDWSCPDNCGDWVEEHHSWAKVIRVSGEQYYHRARARNAGLKIASGEYICNADADLLVQSNFFNLLNSLKPDYYITRIPLCNFIGPISGKLPKRTAIDDILYNKWRDNDGILHTEETSSTGFMIFPSKALGMIEDNGYDEMYDYYLSGGEDLDLRIKLLLEAGIEERWIGENFIKVVSHANELRTENIIEKDFIKSRRGIWGKLSTKWGSSKWQDDFLTIINDSNHKL